MQKRLVKTEGVKEAAKILGVTEYAITCGLKADKYSFGATFVGKGSDQMIYVDMYSLQLVEEGKISPFKGGWVL
ncbi:hypothetical protein [uncultured Anaerococcus sp.]|uniref:hypothetical protein n=1 Tax=uncultured Anaerococcus sp. TaxID=293428 RepID=UPI0025DD1158|nr:hypothetical protein [uncultured Anaerococcus sp.]